MRPRFLITTRFPWSVRFDALMCVKGAIFSRQNVARIILVDDMSDKDGVSFDSLKIVLSEPSIVIDVSEPRLVIDALRQMGLAVRVDA